MKTKLLIACMGLFTFSVIFFVFPRLKKPETEKKKLPNPFSEILDRTVGYEAKPLPSGDGVKVWADFEAPLARVTEREILSTVEYLPISGSVSRAEVAGFMKSFSSFHCGQQTALKQGVDFRSDQKIYREYLGQVERWLDSGADHPSFRYVAMLCGRALKDKPLRWKSAEAGLELLADAGAMHPWIYFEFLEEMSRISEPMKERAAWRKKALDAFPAVFHRTLYEDGEACVMSNRLSYKYEKFLRKPERRPVAMALMSDNQVPDFIGRFADGAAHIDEAWDARGSGKSREVSEKGWMGFREHLDAARESLTAVWEEHPELPEASWKMITVSMGRSVQKNEERKWFDRSVAARFDFQNAYKALALATQPRWGGSLSKLQALADECYVTARYDTNIPFQYFICMRAIMKESSLDPKIYRSLQVQEKIQDILAGYEREDVFGESTIRAGKSYAAAALVYGGKHRKAYDLLKSIGFSESEWFNTSDMGVESWKDYRISAVLKGGPAASNYETMHKMWQTGDLTVAKEACRQLLDDSSLIAAARERLEMESVLIDASEPPGGAWYSVYDRGGEATWAGHYHWQVDEEGRLRGAEKLGCGWLPARVSLVDGFELEYSVDYLSADRPGNNDRAVLFFGRPEWHQYQVVNVRQLFKIKHLKVDRGYQNGDTGKECSLGASNRIRVLVKDEKMSVWVNGELCIKDYSMDASGRYSGPLWVGFGDYWSGNFREKIRFYDVRVKNYADLQAE